MANVFNAPVSVHYFRIPGRHARAGPIRLLLADAQVPFDNVLIQGGWPELKATMIAQGHSPAGVLPVVQIGDQYYPQSGPTIRYLAEKLGYNGETADERYQIGAVGDVAADLGTARARAYFSREEAKIDEFTKNDLPRYLTAINAFLYKFHATGPFVLGDKVSYVDFGVYTALKDAALSDATLSAYPRVKDLIAAVETRPHVAAWLKEHHNDP